MTMSAKRQPGLADVLFGQNRGAVLALLFGNPDKLFYTRQIANMVEASVGAVAPQLTALTRVGVLVSSKSGNQVFYQANRKSPIFEEMKGLVAKTVGIYQQLRTALEPLTSQIAFAFVYGSMAKQQETAESDVDLMMVGDVQLDELLQHLAKVEKQIGRPVNPTIYSVPEFSAKLADGSHFVSSVVRGEKVFVIGGENELRTMGRDQSSQS
jgi:predicted nucleotidyltransferase